MLYKRTDQGHQENPQCIDFVFQIMLTYNTKMVHSSITMTPYEATKSSDEIDVNTNVELQASFTIIYPELEIGSNVKICKTKKWKHKQELVDLVQMLLHSITLLNNTVRHIMMFKVKIGHI